MPFEIRYADRAEIPAVLDLDAVSFGLDYDTDEAVADATLDLAPFRMLVAVDGERIVGHSAEVPMPLTMPGGNRIGGVGITWVSVEVTHRRRGILRSLFEHQARVNAADGEIVQMLTASEGGIYGRLGFGAATRERVTRVDRRLARLREPVDTSRVERLTTDQARDRIVALNDRWRAVTPGAVGRTPERWQVELGEHSWRRAGRSRLHHLVHPDGYVSFRRSTASGAAGYGDVCSIVDYAPVTAEAHAALWQVLLSLDLVDTIESWRIPLDDPIELLLADGRQVRTELVRDGLWLRPLDVGRLLAARTYGVELDTVLEVDDPLFGTGRHRLRGGPDGATCEPTDLAPDVTLRAADVGAVCVGGTRLAGLARAGLVRADDPATLARLDLGLLADRAPAHGNRM